MKVYVDGENFRKGLTRVLLTEKVIKSSRDIKGFPIRLLLEDVLETSKIKLPNGYQPDEKVIEHVQKIKKCPKCGHTHDLLQEKGVDVRLAVDMLEGAYASKDKTLAIMSSDTDLCPALHKVKKQGKQVIYVCFANATNRAVSAVATETVTISTAKLKKYVGLNNE